MSGERQGLVLPPIPVFSRKVPYSAWRDQEDIGKWFRDEMVELAKQHLVTEGDLRTMVNALGVEAKSSKKLGRAHPQLVQYAIDIHDVVGSHEERDVVEAVMPGILQEIQAFCVVTIMGAWAVIGHDITGWYETHDSLSEHPAAQEALTMIWEQAGETGTSCFPITREGDQIILGDNVAPREPGITAQGRFTNWLSAPPSGLN